MINKARDAINSMVGKSTGAALCDLDFVAAFCNTVFKWVFQVLEAKGCRDNTIARIRNIYQESLVITVINGIAGHAIHNIRETLKQGCPGSMGFFSVAIDPLLLYLHRRLQGITICSLPGILQTDGTISPPREEKYIVYGLADDVKPAVTTIEEFGVVDYAANLFELSSGNKLHRETGEKGKCAVLALGKWRRTLRQEQIGFPYLQLADSLSMVGVVLTPTWQSTRKINCDEVVTRVKKTINNWKAGKFMPLVSRPFSINTYALSKAYFCLGSVDLRNEDIKNITSVCKSYCYSDMLMKPSEVLLYRSTEEGGLGLQNIKCRAQAALVTTFLQTAVNPRFQSSLYHYWLYQYHVEEDRSLPDPGHPPYYKKEFFDTIKKFKMTSNLNIIHVNMKQWYLR